MDVRPTLERIGFSPNEVKIYLTLLRSGASKAGKIAKEAQVDRSATYDSLKRLLEKGIISYIVEANQKTYQPVNPKRLLEFIKEKESDVLSILPNLEGLYKLPKTKQNITHYKGIKGVQSVFNDILREGGPNLVFGSEGQFADTMPEWFVNRFLKEQKRKNIHTKTIIRKGRKTDPNQMTEVRFLTIKERSPAVTTIYKNKIAITLWMDNPEAVIIESKEAADSFRSYFEHLWKAAKK